jgi:HSP20 family protein
MTTLHDTFNRLFDEPFFHPRPLFESNVLPLEMVERENELVVSAQVPGFEPEQIDISVQGDLLTLKGEVKEEKEDKNDNYHLREYRSQSFHRTVRLPANVDSNSATAECKNGLLTLHLPKVQASAMKKIAILN